MPGSVEPNFNIPWSDSQVPFSGILARNAQGMPSVNGGDGSYAPVMTDKIGRVVTAGNNIRTLCLNSFNIISTTSAVAISPATTSTSTTFNDLAELLVTTNGSTSATISVSDGTKTVSVFHYPNAGSAPAFPLNIDFTPPLSQSVTGTQWTFTPSSSSNTYYVTTQWVQGL